MNSFETEYRQKKEIIEAYIKKDLSVSQTSYKKVTEAMNYAVLGDGKRLRPVMLTAAYELFGDASEKVLPFCAAIEYIHNYSLIHDDLPAMDNDDLRRGRATCHIKFGEATAILAGDALLTRAFEKMSECELFGAGRAMFVIAKAAGADGMIGGQTIDIENEGKKIPLKLLNELHALKTGALIRASFVAGAILAGAPDEDISRLGEFGSMTGLAFQIKDDILDAYSDEETLGKPIGSDEKNRKTTYLSHFSLEECEHIISDLANKCDDISSVYGEKGNFLKGMTKFLLKRKK